MRLKIISWNSRNLLHRCNICHGFIPLHSGRDCKVQTLTGCTLGLGKITIPLAKISQLHSRVALSLNTFVFHKFVEAAKWEANPQASYKLTPSPALYYQPYGFWMLHWNTRTFQKYFSLIIHSLMYLFMTTDNRIHGGCLVGWRATVQSVSQCKATGV